MVKTTKGGKFMNPADAFRKEQRKREVARNKLERKFTREVVSNRDKPEVIRKELEEIIALEEQGPLNKAQKLRKKVLQDAYDHAIKRQGPASSATASASKPQGDGSVLRPEDSRYYHPTLNPTGAPPPGKANAMAGAITAPVKPAIPLPKPPPLPAGPAPKLPPPPAAPPLPSAPAPSTAPPTVLPPPSGAPPGYPGSVHPTPLPPPAVPPPGWRLPPPSVPPPVVTRLPPPTAPPPLFPPPPARQPAPPGTEQEAAPGTDAAHAAAMPSMPAPPVHPPGATLIQPPGTIHLQQAQQQGAGTAATTSKAATITGSSTVAKRLPAHLDKQLTSMVPAALLVRRDQHKPKPHPRPAPARDGNFFGLAPSSIQKSGFTSAPDPDAPVAFMDVDQPTLVSPAAGGGSAVKPAAPVSADAQYQEFLATMKELGAV